VIVKYDLSLRQSAAELGIELPVEEAAALQDRKLFKQCQEEKRLAHHTEIGSNLKLANEAVEGMVFKLAERLAADQEDFKSSDALLKLMKMQWWVGAELDSFWKAFGVLSQADLDAERKCLKKEHRGQQFQPSEPNREQITDKVN